jgi:chromosome segregation ATPase
MTEDLDKERVQSLAKEIRVLNLVIHNLMKKTDELEEDLAKANKQIQDKDNQYNMFKWRNGNLKKEIRELEEKVARKTEIIHRDQALSLFDAKQHVIAEIGGWLQALSEVDDGRYQGRGDTLRGREDKPEAGQKRVHLNHCYTPK